MNEPVVRFLRADDFDTWDTLSRAYLLELDLPVQGTQAQRLRSFEEKVTNRRIWGCAEGPELIAMASLTALYQQLGQLGVVYTIPERRGQELARRMLCQVLADCVRLHGLNALVLSTGQQDVAAQRLYESLGFTHVGQYGLLFGENSRV